MTVVPRPVAAADLAQPAGAGVQRELVVAGVGHPAVAPEGVLGAVAVVGVVVDDEHALAALGQRRRGDGHVVEQAEPHRPGGGGVVTRGSHRAERRVGLAGVERVDRRQARAGRQERGVVGRADRGGVGVEPPAALGARPLDERHESRRRAPGRARRRSPGEARPG